MSVNDVLANDANKKDSWVDGSLVNDLAAKITAEPHLSVIL